MPTNDEMVTLDMESEHNLHATLADLDDATTEQLHEALTKLSDRVRELWFLAPNNSDDLDVNVLRSQADDIIASIQAGLRPRKEGTKHGE